MRREYPFMHSVYRHFKGKLYYVMAIAGDATTLDEYVVYHALYDDYETWIRPVKEFMEEVEAGKEGNITGQKYRFELIENL
jgi:hypothetical protein